MVSAARVNVEPTKTEYGDGMMADSNVRLLEQQPTLRLMCHSNFVVFFWCVGPSLSSGTARFSVGPLLSQVKQADSGYNKALEAMKREETRRERNREHARVSRERKREHLEALQKENDELRTYLEHVETQADALKASLDGAQQQIYVGMAEISRLRKCLCKESIYAALSLHAVGQVSCSRTNSMKIVAS